MFLLTFQNTHVSLETLEKYKRQNSMTSISSIKSYFQNNKLKLIFFLILVSVNLFVYFPSFFHIARHDQLLYVADAAGNNSWVSLAIKKAINYNRNLHLFPGYSPPLFRPLFYFVLGTKLWLFGYNFAYWQITGFLLHLAVLWFFLSLLFRIHKSIFAGLFVLFFSVLFANIEMIIWHHINSYMIFVACVLLCIQIFYEIIHNKSVSKKQTWILFISLLIACFICETAFLFSAFLFLLSKIFLSPQINEKSLISRHWRLMVISPAIIYLALNLLNLASNWNIISNQQYSLGSESFSLIKALKATFISFYWWLSSGLFPDLLRPTISQRITFNNNQAFLNPQSIFFLRNIISVGFLSLAGAILTYIFILKKSLSKDFLKQRCLFIFLVLGLWGIQIIVLGAMRVSVYGVDLLANCSYYNYLFWPYPIIILYSFIDFNKLPKRHLMITLKIFSFLCLSFLIIVNASKTFKLNLNCAKTWEKQRLIIKKSKELIKTHGHENDFSFIANPGDDLALPWIHKTRIVPSEEPYGYMQMLYPSLTTKQNPKYVVSLTDNEQRKSLQALLEALVNELVETPLQFWRPSDIKPLLFLITMYDQQGQKKKALKIIKRLKSIEPNNKEWQQFLKSQFDLMVQSSLKNN
ncbi:MAG: hypothetical protein PHY73_05385 [Candidatus Omnitrophica bacterium]|nr:hypothetical protein [Candidatus Omnitrophota bacterium]